VSGEDVYDVAKRIEDWEVGECPMCAQPYTRCDCPEDDDDVLAGRGEA
jgi:hypothetical protein